MKLLSKTEESLKKLKPTNCNYITNLSMTNHVLI